MKKLDLNDIGDIIEMYDAGMPVAAIAERYHVTKGYVYRLCKEPGTDRRCKLSPEQKNDIIRRRKNGETCESIGKMYGVSASHVCRLFNYLYYMRRV